MKSRSIVFPTFEEQVSLWTRWRSGDDKAGQKIYESHVNLIRKTARLWAKRYNVDQEDAFLAAREGFFEAMRRFDPDKGTTLGTYAISWMKDRLDRSTRDIKHAPKRSAIADRIQKEVSALLTTNLQWHTPLAQIYNQVAEKLDISAKVVRKHHETLTRRTISLDVSYNGPDSDPLVDMLPDDYRDPLATIQAETASKILHEALEKLDERSRTILRRRFGMTAKAELGEDEDQCATLETLGDEYGISKERVRQIEIAAIQKLRDVMRKKKLSPEFI